MSNANHSMPLLQQISDRRTFYCDTSLCMCNMMVFHTFSVILMSSDCTGQVIFVIFFLTIGGLIPSTPEIGCGSHLFIVFVILVTVCCLRHFVLNYLSVFSNVSLWWTSTLEANIQHYFDFFTRFNALHTCD